MGVNHLPTVVTQLLPRVGFELTTCYRKSNALPVVPPCHLSLIVFHYKWNAEGPRTDIRQMTHCSVKDWQVEHLSRSLLPRATSLPQRWHSGTTSAHSCQTAQEIRIRTDRIKVLHPVQHKHFTGVRPRQSLAILQKIKLTQQKYDIKYNTKNTTRFGRCVRVDWAYSYNPGAWMVTISIPV